MKWSDRFAAAWRGLLKAVGRYPLTLLFLFAAVVVNAMAIEEVAMVEETYAKLLAAFIVGAFLATLAQVVYEQGEDTGVKRLILSLASVVLTAGYLWSIWGAPEVGIQIVVRTAALLSAIIVGCVWVPSIRGRITFNETFMGAFKAFFISLFFSGVIFAGVSMILGAVDLLLFSIDEMLFAHSANIIFILFAPTYFLSLIPNFNTADRALVDRTVDCPRFLNILISNILIPLVSIFTVILVVYIGINVSGEFWTENLTEQMLVAYSIVVLIILILSANLTNRFATIFRKVFPKVLIPLVVLQLVASILKIGSVGLTHSRYYVIMYGVFAAVAGIVFSFMKHTKSGIIAIVFIAFSLVSTIPPVDAFGVSRRSQISTLETVLESNGMLVDGQIIPNSDIPSEDKDLIINTTRYLWRMDYVEDVSWLGLDFDYYRDFEQIYGFNWSDYDGDIRIYLYFYRDKGLAMDISGYDALAYMHYYNDPNRDGIETETIALTHQGLDYSLGWDLSEEGDYLYLEDAAGTRLISFDVEQIRSRLEGLGGEESEENILTSEQATFTSEGGAASMKVIVEYFELYPAEPDGDGWYINGEVHVLIDWND